MFWFVPTGEVLRNTLAPAAAQVAAASMPAGRRLHVAGEGVHEPFSACREARHPLSRAAQQACAGRAAGPQPHCLLGGACMWQVKLYIAALSAWLSAVLLLSSAAQCSCAGRAAGPQPQRLLGGACML